MYPTTQLAENHISISRALFDEGMRATENPSYQKAIRKLALVLLGLYLAVAAWLFYTGGSLIFLLGESIFLGALLFWLFVMLPGTKRRSKYKAMVHQSSHIPQRVIKFYGDHLSVTADTGKVTSIPYKDIENWQETNHLYILNCKNKLAVFLDKNGFTSGSFQTVLTVLKK